MQDKVSLHIGDRVINDFVSYSIEADLFTADDAFTIELANPETGITEGARCKLDVNGHPELNGIIDRITESYDKSGRKLKVEGRDLMGLLVDSYCENFLTIKNTPLKSLAERLIKTVPFINRNSVVYEDNAAKIDHPLKFAQIEPGMTIFEVLKRYSQSRGLLFWAKPDGKIVFGKPKKTGKASYSLVCTKDGKENNIIEGERVRDISKRYSKVIVKGQQQGDDDISAEAINTPDGIKTDPDFPFYKPFVETDNNDQQSPALHARLILEKQKMEGLQLKYKVAGHSRNGKNWAINEFCAVKDGIIGIDRTFLIYGRTFEMSKQGAYTNLRLGFPGMVQ